MASSAERLLLSRVDSFLDNQTLRNQCTSTVCQTLKVPDVCSTATQQNCLVLYGFGMSLAETYQVAVQADFETRMQQQAQHRASDVFDEAIPEKEPPPPPFKPDWRFWGGVTLAGVGLFLHRSR